MKVLLTCGGTREPLDAARSITNLSTGHTGRVLAEALAARGCEVHCLRASGSELPAGKGLRLTEFSSFKDLDEALRKALAAEAFTAVIHLAAVSDYSPALIEAAGKTFIPGRGTKLDSSLPELRVTLKRNFKIVDLIKDYSEAAGNPAPLLISFKLTSGASPARVIKKVRALFCADLVVHNDLSEMKKKHVFHLYKNGMHINNCTGAEALAEKLYGFINANISCSVAARGPGKQKPAGGLSLHKREGQVCVGEGRARCAGGAKRHNLTLFFRPGPCGGTVNAA